MSEQLPPPESDKEKLWGWWYSAKKWQDKLHKSAAHKALDIPEDEMAGIQANKEMVVNNSGMSPAWLLATAVIGLGGLYLYNQAKPEGAAVVNQQTDEQITKEIIERNLKLRLFHNGREIQAVPKGSDG